MTYHVDIRQGLPDDMHVLLGDYPREAWPDHPNFARSIQNWMGAHTMFRDLSAIVTTDTKRFLDKDSDPQVYADRLAYFGNLLLRNLHGHHSWEDRKFFPELGTAEERLAPGLEMLEADHVALDARLSRFKLSANRIVQLAQLSPDDMRDEAAEVRDASGAIGQLLERHLADEEDLVVPIILHHKLRG